MPRREALVPSSRSATALLTLWQGDDGAWHARVVMADGCRVDFDSPFELARWSRRAAPAPRRATSTMDGLR